MLERAGYRHTLLGADGYWVEGERFGVTYDEETVQLYGGLRAFAWVFSEIGPVALPDPSPPEGAHLIRGVQIPDAAWRRLRP